MRDTQPRVASATAAILGVAMLPLLAMSAAVTPKAQVPRIVGGYAARSPEWLTVLRSGFMGDRHGCGASLIDKQWILTAAHCVRALTPVNLTYAAWIGGSVESNPDEFERIPLDMVVSHPEFTTNDYEYDIALGRLAWPSTKEPAVINTDPANDATGKMLSVMGWGTESAEIKVLSDQVRRVEVPVATQSVCRATMGYPGGEPTTLCAGFKTGGYDACLGDSGGPLFTGNVVVGIVSFGNQCALPDLYGVYTRVSYFGNWIRENIAANKPTQAAPITNAVSPTSSSPVVATTTVSVAADTSSAPAPVQSSIPMPTWTFVPTIITLTPTRTTTSSRRTTTRRTTTSSTRSTSRNKTTTQKSSTDKSTTTSKQRATSAIRTTIAPTAVSKSTARTTKATTTKATTTKRKTSTTTTRA